MKIQTDIQQQSRAAGHLDFHSGEKLKGSSLSPPSLFLTASPPSLPSKSTIQRLPRPTSRPPISEGDITVPAARSLTEEMQTWLGVLNGGNHTSAEYRSAAHSWPAGQQIWPLLSSRRAKIGFIRYILETDRTNCRPYSTSMPGQEAGCQTFARNQETFNNVCQGFATQLHIRFRSTSAPPSRDEIERLRTRARIYYESIDNKFRIPILMASIPGHAFNAVLIGNSEADINSYLFIEPQTDQIFEPNSRVFNQYFRVGLLNISELESFNERGQYIERNRQVFARGASGQPENVGNISGPQRISLHNLLAAIFIADDGADTFRATLTNRGITYEQNIQQVARRQSDSALVFAGRYSIGRQFRRRPGGVVQRLTIPVYIGLVNRPGIRRALTIQQYNLNPPPVDTTSGPRTETA